MANDNHLFSVPCYNGTMLKQDYYNNFFEIGQQKINFSFYEKDKNINCGEFEYGLLLCSSDW